MSRMLFLRDIQADVLVRCRACGHEGRLPLDAMRRRFGPNYPVLSIAPHFRCSRCNSRDVESRPASPPQAAPAAAEAGAESFNSTLAALQGLMSAARAGRPAAETPPPPPAVRAAAEAPPPPPPPPAVRAAPEPDDAEPDLARALLALGALAGDDGEDEEEEGAAAFASGDWRIGPEADDEPEAAPETEPEPEPEPETEPHPAPAPAFARIPAPAYRTSPAAGDFDLAALRAMVERAAGEEPSPAPPRPAPPPRPAIKAEAPPPPPPEPAPAPAMPRTPVREADEPGEDRFALLRALTAALDDDPDLPVHEDEDEDVLPSGEEAGAHGRPHPPRALSDVPDDALAGFAIRDPDAPRPAPPAHRPFPAEAGEAPRRRSSPPPDPALGETIARLRSMLDLDRPGAPPPTRPRR